MRATTLARKLLGSILLFVTGIYFEEDCFVVKVRPHWRRPRCSVCGEKCTAYDRLPERHWRHLAIGRIKIIIRYGPRRVDCRKCGVKVEKVPWASEARSRFTTEFEEKAAYLAQITDKTTVTKLLGICWRTVGEIVERVVSKRLDPNRLLNLQRIGIDEFSYRKNHRYITTVVDHDTERVVWAAKGKSSDVLKLFFDEIKEEGCKRLKTVTMDMSASYMKAVRERVPQAEITFDRFHVQALASKAVDEVRRNLVRELKGTEESKFIKKSRWVLLKNNFNLTRNQQRKLSDIQRNNKPLYRAYLLKEELARILDYKQPGRAEKSLDEWLSWAFRSGLKPFVKLAHTIQTHKEGILRYVKHRLTNAIVEGFNNRLRMVARRSYGFHSEKPLISMLYLCCGGIDLNPPLPSTYQPA